MYYLAVCLVLILCLWPVINYAKTPPPLVLSKLYQANEQLTNYWVSEKYDGVRAYWDGKALYTRSGNVINAPKYWLTGFPSTPLDGELWIDRHQFSRLSGIIRKKSPTNDEWQDVKFMAFDLPKDTGNFIERYRRLEATIYAAQLDHLKLVEQQAVDSHFNLQKQLEHIASQGGEGLMLRRIDTVYTSGRSNDLLKVKPYMDDEAVVIDHQQGQGKYTDHLGALIVMDQNGREFKIGTGFSDADRSNPPAIGDTITYQYHGRTATGLPRFASYLRIKHSE